MIPLVNEKHLNQPVSCVEWIRREQLTPNSYNPNKQDSSRHALLIQSILEDGWTQPIVAFRETREIVDGEHRWRAAGYLDVAGLTDGFVPVVWIDSPNVESRKISTCRHNLARGVHGVRLMIDIVKDLLKTVSPDEIMKRLQMEPEELERLSELAGMPIKIGAEKAKAFSKGWIPVLKSERDGSSR